MLFIAAFLFHDRVQKMLEFAKSIRPQAPYGKETTLLSSSPLISDSENHEEVQ